MQTSSLHIAAPYVAFETFAKAQLAAAQLSAECDDDWRYTPHTLENGEHVIEVYTGDYFLGLI